MARDTGLTQRGQSWEAWVWVPRDKKKLRKTFSGKGAKSAAKNWRADALKPVREGTMRAPTRQTLREAADEFLAGAEAGKIRKRNGETYKPAVLRNYRSALTRHVLNEFGDRRLDSITFTELERLQENLQATLSGSTVRNCFVPLKTIYKRAKRAGVIAVKPTDDLELPTAGTADRSATPAQAATTIEALPEEDRALWATAFYAGLRRGELRALRVENVYDNYIDVQHGWDDIAGEQAPKSKAGLRRVPLTETLRPYLDAHIERTGRSGKDLLFGKTATAPFASREVSDRADEAWKGAERWMLKEARASFRTWLDATTIGDTRADRYHGHSDGHVRGRYIIPPDSQLAEDAAKLDAYLAGTKAGKVVTLGATG
jgi:integrase